MEPKSLEIRTLDELRALARTAGLRGYSGLRKKQLIELLVKQKAPASVARAKPEIKAKVRGDRPKTSTAPGTPPARTHAVTATDTAATEERIESAKFQMTPPQTPLRQTFVSSLQEDIDRFPAAGEPLLCLLPQKPGVVHAYWTLQPGAQTKRLRLRLCYATADAIELLDEVEVAGASGHWYFHVPETSEPGKLFAHLGYYDAGAFVTAIRRGIARIPNLYASGRTDSSWWISDEDFRAMYLRAGGVVRGKRLLWPGSGSSEKLIVKNEK